MEGTSAFSKLINYSICKLSLLWIILGDLWKSLFTSLWLVLSALTTFQIVYRDFTFSWDNLFGMARPALDGIYFNFTDSFYTQSSTRLVALGVFVLFQHRTCVWFMTVVIVVMSAVAANEISSGALKTIKSCEGPFEVVAYEIFNNYSGTSFIKVRSTLKNTLLSLL